jgi:hypothetical protein
MFSHPIEKKLTVNFFPIISQMGNATSINEHERAYMDFQCMHGRLGKLYNDYTNRVKVGFFTYGPHSPWRKPDPPISFATLRDYHCINKDLTDKEVEKYMWIALKCRYDSMVDKPLDEIPEKVMLARRKQFDDVHVKLFQGALHP